MYTNDSDIQFKDGKFHCNINIIFHATSTMEYKEIIVTTSILDSCNRGRIIHFFLCAGRPNSSFTGKLYMDDLRTVPNKFVITTRTVRVNVSDGPVEAWPSKLGIDVLRTETYRWIGIGLHR